MKIEFVPTAVDHMNVMTYASNRLKNDLKQSKSTLHSILLSLPVTFLFVVPAMLFVANHPIGTNLYIGYLVGIFILFFCIHSNKISKETSLAQFRDSFD